MTNSELISYSSLIVAGISAAIAAWGLWFTRKQWEKVKAKVTMLTDSVKAFEVVPAWYTDRMMRDYWLFGLLTKDGRVIVIKQITAISDDGKWMDVELAEEGDFSGDLKKFGTPVFAVAADRVSASVSIDSIVAALDLQTS
jgi:hypothetical protein